MNKIERAFRFVKFFLSLSRDHKETIKNMQNKYNFNKERALRIHFMDAEKHYDFKVVNGGFKPMILPSKPDVEIFVEEICTLKHLRLGVKLGEHPGTGQKVPMAYTLLNAWSYGEISGSGDMSTNDLISFVDLFFEVVGLIPEKDLIDVIGPCEHDVK